MTRTLLLMAWWQIRNSIRASLRRPIVWIPALLFLVAFPLQMERLMSPTGGQSSGMGAAVLAHADVVRAAVFVGLALLAAGYMDRGLNGGAFTFDLADVAFLFPSPVPRRLVLLFKLPAVTLSLLGFVGLLAWYFRLYVWLPAHAPGLLKPGGGWAALLAAALCVGGFLHLAMTLDVAGSEARPVVARRVFLAVVLLTLAAGGWFAWTQGLAALRHIGSSVTWNVLLFPCALAADAVAAPLTGKTLSLWAWPVLLTWYGGTLALLLTRRTNFYEAAAVHSEQAAKTRAAMRSGDWAGARNVKAQRPNTRPGLTLHGFGTGAGALWAAHLSAALKRPWLNVFGPAAAGVLFVIVALVINLRIADRNPAMSDSTMSGVKTLLLVVTGYYVFYAVQTLAIPFYRRALAREGFGRVLPVPLWKTVLAEVGVRSALGSLFPITEGVTLVAAWRVPELRETGVALLVLVPAGIVCINALSFRLAVAYPNAADRAQYTVSAFVGLFWTGVLATWLAVWYFTPVLLHAPDAVIGLSLLTGTLVTALFLLRMATRAFAAFQPAGDAPPANSRAALRDLRQGLTPPTMKKNLRSLLVAAVLVALLVFIGARASKKPPPTPPRTVAARVGTLLVSVSETGTVQPVDKINVQSKVSGRLLSIPVVEGQRVQSGQLIATVDRSQLDPQIQGQRAQLTQAEARLSEAEAQARQQQMQTESSIASARASLVQAQAHLVAVSAPARVQDVTQQRQAVDRAQIALNDALRTQKRRASLLTKGFVSQADVDAAQVAVDTAQSNVDAARAALSLTNAGPRTQDIADAQAGVNVARAAVQSAEAGRSQYPVSQAATEQARAAVQQTQTALTQLMVQSADTRIVAPAGGIVLKKYKQIGEIVQSSLTGFSDAQSLVATLGSRLEVQVGINEVDIPKVRQGAPVLIHVDALPNVSFQGRVSEVSPASTNAFASADTSGGGGSSISKFNVKIALAKYDARLRPGMTAQADIESAKHAKAVLVPLEAVPFTTRTGTVQVLTADNKQQPRKVTIGLKSDTDAEVVAGLRAGDKVVVPDADGKDRPKFDVNGG